jgi:hypothetical protein
MKDPAFLFYSSDFLTGVSDLTMEERGQYITLLCLQHQKGHLSEKTIRLSVGSISVDVRNKFSTDLDGNLYNEVLDDKIKERLKFTESRRNNGIKGGRPKKELKPIGYPKDNLPENENENIIVDINTDNNTLLLFDEFRKIYPGIKRGNKTEFDNFCKKHKDWKSILPNLKIAVENQIKLRDIKKSNGQFIPEWKNIQTWINQRCWEEITEIIPKKSIFVQ